MNKFTSVLARSALSVACLLATASAFAADASADQAQIARGHYLALASDCIACHTAAKGQPFGGGYAIATPFGKIFGSNISSDKDYGIGNWTDQQFVDAVRKGVRPDGQHLYPAMPYDSFTKMRPEDVLDIKAYLMSLPAVHVATPENKLGFPFNQRWGMMFWNLANFKEGVYQNDPKQSAEWNRGAYMVEALAHCEECHTPRNVTMGLNGSRAFGGGDLGAWFAYNITPDQKNGVGAWSDKQLVQYLHTGDVPGKASAAGPMAEAVENSLQYLKPEDLQAIVTYLRTVPAQTGPDTVSRSDLSKPATDYVALRGTQADQLDAHNGAALFLQHCAACHSATGSGIGEGPTAYPSLYHHSAVGASESTNLVSVILSGVDRKMASGPISMPSFAHDMSNEDIAALANYVTGQFGNSATHTTPADVAKLRTVDMKPYPDLVQTK